MANTVEPYKPVDKYGDQMFVPSVFVEFESLAYIVISLLEECIFPVYLRPLCRCIPCLTPETSPFQVVHLSGGLVSTAE